MSTFTAKSLFPASRQAILSLLYGQPNTEFYLRQIAQQTQLAVGNVQRELTKLSDDGILSRRKTPRHVYFQANRDCPIFDELCGIADKTGNQQTKRSVVIRKTSNEESDSGYMPGTMAERISSVWNITQSVWTFVKDNNAREEFQRDVSVLNRQGR